MSTTTRNARGEWVPAIPVPFYGLRKHCCDCKRKFWREVSYRAHYALVHILEGR
jgi:hypothetical protein